MKKLFFLFGFIVIAFSVMNAVQNSTDNTSPPADVLGDNVAETAIDEMNYDDNLVAWQSVEGLAAAEIVCISAVELQTIERAILVSNLNNTEATTYDTGFMRNGQGCHILKHPMTTNLS